MRIVVIALSLLAAAPLAQAGSNGEHPAIVARRVIAAQGFDHASAFYRHPAGLDLAATAPARADDQPEAVTARRTDARHRAATRAASRR